jgi:hypothetical protein
MLIAFLISQRGVASKGLSAVRREDARNFTHTITSVPSRACDHALLLANFWKSHPAIPRGAIKSPT